MDAAKVLLFLYCARIRAKKFKKYAKHNTKSRLIGTS